MQFATMTLENMPVISVDLETTGLNTAHDRVIQIGTISPKVAGSAHQTFVNPGISIPQASTEIHGISDDDVAYAEPFSLAFQHCRDAMKDKVVIGYNIGFDLAVISSETERHGIDWQLGPALCLRQLATVALGQDAMLMMGDLDALATHYHIDKTARHSALGDAEICAKLYYAMITDLQAKSINTYGDAKRAVAALDQQRIATTRAGWIDVASLKQPNLFSRPLARIDPYPYRHRIHEIMMTAPLILMPNCTLQEAAIQLRETRHDCAFVGHSSNDIKGIISERDIVRAIAMPINEVQRARDIAIEDIMSSPVICVQETDFMHVALGRIARHDIRHLGVIDGQGNMTGWLSTRELIRQRVSDAIVIGDEINSAQSSNELGKALSNLPSLAASLTKENVASADISSVISGEYRAALSRSTALAEAKIIKSLGPVPREYAVLILGSGGRGESLLAADQDHAIIYDDKTKPIDVSEAQHIQNWFEALGSEISDILHEAGIPYCNGGVMSSSPKWCKSLTGWRKTIGQWSRKARPDDLLSADIFFDFAVVYGESYLGWSLQQAIAGRAVRTPQFLKSISRSVGQHHGGTNLFGKLRTKNGRYQIKLHMLLPLIESLRVLAVSKGLHARNSHERAKQLFETRTVPVEILQISEDIQFCMQLVLRQQIEDIAEGLAPITDINLDGISKPEQKRLKTISSRVGRLDQMLQDTLF